MSNDARYTLSFLWLVCLGVMIVPDLLVFVGSFLTVSGEFTPFHLGRVDDFFSCHFRWKDLTMRLLTVWHRNYLGEEKNWCLFLDIFFWVCGWCGWEAVSLWLVWLFDLMQQMFRTALDMRVPAASLYGLQTLCMVDAVYMLLVFLALFVSSVSRQLSL